MTILYHFVSKENDIFIILIINNLLKIVVWVITTLSGAKAAALGIAALKKSGYGVKTLQEYH